MFTRGVACGSTLALLSLAGVCGPAAAQPATAPGTVYLLRGPSVEQEGCFELCLCPIQLNGSVTGTFVLQPAPSAYPTARYAVRSVNWAFKSPGAATITRVTGSGVYERVVAVGGTERMTLTLSFNGGPGRAFDSGPVPSVPGAVFPAIDIVLSENGIPACHDTRLSIAASPRTCDWNASGAVELADIFSFLQDWFAGDADFDGDGATDVRDIFGFLADWFVQM